MPQAWLCRPGSLRDACARSVGVAVVHADGRIGALTLKRNPKANIDCFYVYPTVSRDPGVVADLRPGPEEVHAVRLQFAPFSSVCRPFAPLYRQYTVPAMEADLSGRPLPGSDDPAITGTGYSDVLTAWRYYLRHDNHGRGVVLIGHSQGSRILSRLIAEEIDGKAIQSRLVSALLIGRPIPLDKGKQTGLFKTVPLCSSSRETGCFVAYSAYRDRLPPSLGALFGKPANAAQTAACSNPAELARGSRNLNGYLANGPEIIPGLASRRVQWVRGKPNPRQELIAVPGLLSASCVERDGFTYLEIHVASNPDDPRLDDIKGDVIASGQPDRRWGLHLIDMNLALGDLIAIVGDQGRVFANREARRRRR